MTVLQLVVSNSGGDRRTAGDLAVVPNPQQIAPENFSSDSGTPAMLGSHDLLTLGSLLSGAGLYVPIDIDLGDQRFSSLDEEDASFINDRLMPLVRSGDVDRVLGFATKHMRWIFVLQLRMRDTASGSVITFAQDGVLLTARESDEPGLSKNLAQIRHLMRPMRE